MNWILDWCVSLERPFEVDAANRMTGYWAWMWCRLPSGELITIPTLLPHACDTESGK